MLEKPQLTSFVWHLTPLYTASYPIISLNPFKEYKSNIIKKTHKTGCTSYFPQAVTISFSLQQRKNQLILDDIER